MTERRDINGLTEKEFLEQYTDTLYDKPSVTTDILVLGVDESFARLKALLIKRDEHPYLGFYALPGGFIKKDETAYQAASRKLYEEAGVRDVYLDQIYTFTRPGRDPRTWVMSIAYLALVGDVSEIKTTGEWFDLEFDDDRIRLYNDESGAEIIYPVSVKKFKNGRIGYENRVAISGERGEKLAFDHVEIIIESIMKLRTFFENSDIAFNMVGDTFTLPDLQALYELVLGKKLYKTNFRALVAPKIEATGAKIKSRISNKMSAEYRYIG
ncbi:NUDIX domain-containing protein [Butyrivibrio sp. XPD2006]|uniref:NUDIX domain-containing protein n=1 Tax=Butyrivibrio sp. XPD2006 TaxID=1280668 RepID=UPI0003B4CCA4|nr:NUDIX domain-containing protein [Butyrivibrio sp. XPD2006]